MVDISENKAALRIRFVEDYRAVDCVYEQIWDLLRVSFHIKVEMCSSQGYVLLP